MVRPPISKAHPYTPKSGKFAGQTFHTEREYRNALAKAKGFKNWYAEQQAPKKVRTDIGLAKLRPSELEARMNSLAAVAKMRREGISLKQAAKEYGVTPNAIKRHAGSALSLEHGRYRVKASDRLLRDMRVLTTSGQLELGLKDSRAASKVGRYEAAVRHFLDTGDASKLRQFRGQGVTIDKVFYPFETDPAKIRAAYEQGLISFEDIYVKRQAA